MNRYGAIARDHWKRWLPDRYARLDDPEAFFAALGDEIAAEVEELSSALAGDDQPGEGYLNKLGRLNNARFCAEAQILREMALLAPEEDFDLNDADVRARPADGRCPRCGPVDDAP